VTRNTTILSLLESVVHDLYPKCKLDPGEMKNYKIKSKGDSVIFEIWKGVYPTLASNDLKIFKKLKPEIGIY
jgi:hypothetical protein